MDHRYLNLSQQFCQSINTFGVKKFFFQKKYLGKTFFGQQKIRQKNFKKKFAKINFQSKKMTK